jgi:hypothetical protein
MGQTIIGGRSKRVDLWGSQIRVLSTKGNIEVRCANCWYYMFL